MIGPTTPKKLLADIEEHVLKLRARLEAGEPVESVLRVWEETAEAVRKELERESPSKN